MNNTTFKELFDILSRIKESRNGGAIQASAFLTESVLGVTIEWLENGKDKVWYTHTVPIDDVEKLDYPVETVFGQL